MIDEEAKGDSAASAGASADRGARPDPDVIESEIAAAGTSENERPPDPPPSESGAEPRLAPAAAPRSGAHGFLGGALAGLVVSALALGAGYALLVPRADTPEIANSLNAIEAQAERQNAALAADLSRNRDAVAGLEKRVTALEAAGAGNSSASDASERLAAQEKDLKAGIDAERGATSDLTARVAELETGAQKTSAASADLAALGARVGKIETALAAPKTEARSPADTAAAIAIIAEAAEERLRDGEPLGPDVAALQHLGVDAAALAPLQAVAAGAPANAALAASFSAVAPRILAAASRKDTGGVVDRFLVHLHSLVQVRDLNETAGDDPPALASQIEAMSRRGDIGGALASFNKLPEAARQAAGDWPALARARQAADAALQSIREAAIGQLASGPKP
jgi:hypothetical protein